MADKAVAETGNQAEAPLVLPGALRRARMVEFIDRNDFVRVGELADEFNISEVTVRADLDRLGRHVHRVRGGALSRNAAIAEPSLEESLTQDAVEKDRIARVAAGLIVNGDALLLDVGSTTTAVARALAARTELNHVTVVTNSLTVALELEPAHPRIQVVVTGGTLRPRQHSLVDPMGTVLLDQIHVNYAFLGCNGISAAGGITNANMPEAEIKRRMIPAADRVVVVAVGAKVGQTQFARVAQLADAHMLITTRGDEVEMARLREAGLNVVIAHE